MQRRHQLIVNACGTLLAMSFSVSAVALGYGIYDTRGQAMGGAAVAVGAWHSAQYYNPALLALHNEREDDTLDGRFIFPNIVVQGDTSIEDVADAVEDELDTRLGNSVNDFNADPSAENAAAVVADARDLQVLLDDLGNQDITGDAFFGLSVSEPSLLEGGAFYFGARALGFASSVIPAEDMQLLEQYIGALDIVAGGGDILDIPSELVDENGNLIDPTEQFNSSADLSGVLISEWAVAMAKQVNVFGQALALGVTPKVMRVDVFRETTDFDTDNLDFIGSQKTYINMNADLGLALQLFDHYRLALAVKDVIPEEFTTENDLLLQLRPRARFGMAYVNDWVSVGVDVDLGENEPLATEAVTQDASFGVEILPFQALALRFGYRQDLTGLREDVLAGGLAYQLGPAVLELSLSKGQDNAGVGMQLGWLF